MRTNKPVPAILLLLLMSVSNIGAGAENASAGKFGPWQVKKAAMQAEWKIDAEYPVFDLPDIDNHIKAWLTAHAASVMDDVKDSADADIPEMLFSLEIRYSVTAAPSGAVNVLFTSLSESNHAAHPSTRLNTLNFSPKGKILFLDSLFAWPDRALDIFAREAPQRIKEYYSDQKEELADLDSMIAEGTKAIRENYSCYAVEPDGLRIHFQQYQVVPYYLGMPDVLIPLAALAPAGPNAEIWPIR